MSLGKRRPGFLKYKDAQKKHKNFVAPQKSQCFYHAMTRVLVILAGRWLETDRAAAWAWIFDSSLSDEAKQRLLAKAQLDTGH